MSIRRFDFVTQIETSEAPPVVAPSDSNDVLTLGFADDRYVAGRGAVSSLADLAAIDTTTVQNGDVVFVFQNYTALWFYNASSTEAAATGRVIVPNSGVGRWFRISDLDVTDSLLVEGNLTVTGNVSVTGNATLNGNVTGTGVLDEDNMVSNSAVKVATQQSIKAYVDTEVGAVDTDLSNHIAATSAHGVAGSVVGTTDTQNISGKTFTDNSGWSGTGATKLPAGSTAQRPTGETGFIRFNSTDGNFEGYNGTDWEAVGTGPGGGGGQDSTNIIINGDMAISQRGTSFTGVSSAYTLDRWQVINATDGVVDVNLQADGPGSVSESHFLNKSLLLNCTTSDASIGASQGAVIRQSVEGHNFTQIARRPFTISFWVKATKTGTYCVGFRNSGEDRSYVAEYSVVSGGTWEKKTITVLASPAAGTWNYENGIGLKIDFVIASGTDLHTTAGAWQTGNFAATANQVNGLDSTDNTFLITGVMVNPGDEASDFTRAAGSLGSELALCKRYFVVGRAATVIGNSATSARFILSYNEMRAAPTPTANSLIAGIVLADSTNTFASSSLALVGNQVTPYFAQLNIDTYTGLIAGKLYYQNYGADGSSFSLSAEL